MSDTPARLYLDNAATSHPKPAVVVEAMSAFLRDVGGAPARGGHAEALGASRVVHRARSALARLIGAPDASRVTFQPGATAALNVALAGSLGAGERVVTTDMEHNAVRRPLLRLARERGVVVEEIATARRSDAEVLESLDRALARRPRMVAVQHASNVNGRVLPVAAMGERIARAGATFVVDAAQSAGVVPIDVVAMGIHLLALPGHKGLLGPQGVGALWIAPGHEPAPLVVGGTGSRSEDDEPPLELPERYESGTLNAVGIAGLGAALRFIEELGVEALGHRERERADELAEALHGLPGLSLVGVPEGATRTGVVSVTFDELDPASVGQWLDREHGIATRAGLHCAPSAHRALGTFPVGTLRFSVGPTTTSRDVERAANALARLLERPSDRIAVGSAEHLGRRAMGTYRRDPKIMWRREKGAEARAREALAGAEADAAADLGTVTLVTGGRMVQLNLVGGEIWELLDGTRDEEALLGELADRFDAPREMLAADLVGFLAELSAEGWIHHV